MGYTVQVKRRRNEDPLQALVYYGSKRRRASDDTEVALEIGRPTGAEYVFRLADTLDMPQQKHVTLERLYASAANKLGISIEHRAKYRRSEAGAKPPNKALSSASPKMPEQISINEEENAALYSLLAAYIEPQKLSSPAIDELLADKETEEYVYDVYYSGQAGPLTEHNVGYIEVDEAEEKLLFQSTDSDEDLHLADDDEDSNDEGHYKNDYPDEEDEEEEFSEQDSLYEKLGDFNLDEWSEDERGEEERYGWSR